MPSNFRCLFDLSKLAAFEKVSFAELHGSKVEELVSGDAMWSEILDLVADIWIHWYRVRSRAYDGHYVWHTASEEG